MRPAPPASPPPAWVGAWLRRRRFGPVLAAQRAAQRGARRDGDLVGDGLAGGFFAGLDGPAALASTDPLVADARRQIARIDAAAAQARAEAVDHQRRRLFAGLIAAGGAITPSQPRRRRGPIARLIAALF